MFRYILQGALATLAIADTTMHTQMIEADKVPIQNLTHPKFKEAFEPWKHSATWKPFEIVTDDGYIITVF